MTCSVIGLGKLGLCIAAVLAKHFKVTAIDIDEKRIEYLNAGENPIKEPSLDTWLKNYRANITFINRFENFGDIVFVVVPTPSTRDHTFTSEFVENALDYIPSGKSVVIVSTLMPRETDRLQEKYPHLNIIYSPTFIALGNVINNFVYPDFILVGTDNNRGLAEVLKIYEKICYKPNFIILSTLEVEIAKITLNCYITAKITFANQIGNLCYRMGVKPDRILNAVGQDKRIGNKYFKAGLGYGGPCFPRDNLALAAFMKKEGANPQLLQTIHNLNYDQIDEFVKRIIKLKPTTVGFEDISYKRGTNFTEHSHLAKIKQKLEGKGYKAVIGKGDVNVNWEGIT